MRVLVTGVNGFIGRCLAVTAASRGHSIVGLGRAPTCAAEGVSDYVRADVLDRDVVVRACRNVDAVVHLAALTAHADIVDRRYETLETNFIGTKNVLDGVLSSASARRFVYGSTGKVYGRVLELPLRESHACLPRNHLGKSKRIAERLMDFYSDEGLELVALRIFNVYGPGQSDNFLVPTVVRQFVAQTGRSDRRILLGDVAALRDYVYLDDVVEAMIASLDAPLDPVMTVLNVCSGEGVSARDVTCRLAAQLGVEVEIEVDEGRLRADEDPVEYGSYTEATRRLGWAPRTALGDGLRRTLEWYAARAADVR